MDIPEPLRPLAAALAAARASADPQALAALYADDGMLILPDGARVQGPAAIAEYCRLQAAGTRRPAQAVTKAGAAKWFYYPPIAHALTTASGRHGEKHSLIDIAVLQADGAYRLVCSSWTG